MALRLALNRIERRHILTNLVLPKVSYEREAHLLEKYGELLTLRELAVLLKFPSAEAIRQAHRRGTAPVPLFKVPNRRDWYASTRAVAALFAIADGFQSTRPIRGVAHEDVA